jgi:D-tyrosyl-tRNA(Tyr) deacylase
MKAVIQRVKSSEVWVEGKKVSHVNYGLLVLLGIASKDIETDAAYLASKLIGLRIFEDANGKMNLSLSDVGGELMIVSQFTLLGDCRKGRRPSFVGAAPPEKALSLYEFFLQRYKEQGIRVATGAFGEKMELHLINDGPVTIILDSSERSL